MRPGQLVALLAPFLGAVAALAQPGPLPAPEPLVAHRIRGAIHLDGRSDEPAWREVAPLPVVSQVPRFGAPPS
ncbi:MAG: hypothetical protein ABIL09_29500, partial [Gemmatimonadota bacterium]